MYLESFFHCSLQILKLCQGWMENITEQLFPALSRDVSSSLGSSRTMDQDIHRFVARHSCFIFAVGLGSLCGWNEILHNYSEVLSRMFQRPILSQGCLPVYIRYKIYLTNTQQFYNFQCLFHSFFSALYKSFDPTIGFLVTSLTKSLLAS